jgi:hypothetical protein
MNGWHQLINGWHELISWHQLIILSIVQRSGMVRGLCVILLSR